MGAERERQEGDEGGVKLGGGGAGDFTLGVRIRPHTSAYVSIRQHTSAYVSKPNVRAPASLGDIWLSLCEPMLQMKCEHTLCSLTERERPGEWDGWRERGWGGRSEYVRIRRNTIFS
jgi:hypothetical protein